MEFTRENDLIEKESLEGVSSCSSSILNTPDREDMYVDDDDYDDGINVTLLSSSVIMESNKDSLQNTVEEKQMEASIATLNSTNNGDEKGCSKLPSTAVATSDKKQKRLNGAGKKRFKYLVAHGHSPNEDRILAETPFRVVQPDPSKRRRNADLSESTSSDTNPPKKLARQVVRGQSSKAKSSVQQRLEQASKGGVSLDPKEAEGNNRLNKPLFSEVVNCTRIGILPEGFPNTEFTTQQLVTIQNAILKKSC